ncbi:MAG: host attachment protein [Candidatus Hydrogenedentota bacterium]
MDRTWYLVANASTARVYAKTPGNKTLQLLHEYNHPESREPRRELKRDRHGHYAGAGKGHGSMVEPTDPKKQEASRFAREIASALHHAHAKNEFERLVLVTPPSFFQHLKKPMEPLLHECVNTVIEKDYTKTDPKKLAEHLEKHVLLTQ